MDQQARSLSMLLGIILIVITILVYGIWTLLDYWGPFPSAPPFWYVAGATIGIAGGILVVNMKKAAWGTLICAVVCLLISIEGLVEMIDYSPKPRRSRYQPVYYGIVLGAPQYPIWGIYMIAAPLAMVPGDTMTTITYYFLNRDTTSGRKLRLPGKYPYVLLGAHVVIFALFTLGFAHSFWRLKRLE